MDMRALCFLRCAALLIMLTTSFKSVSGDLPHLQNSHSGLREKLAAIAKQPTAKTSPTVARNMRTSASKLLRENASSHQMTPVLTTVGTTKSVSLLQGAPPATEHACPELRFHAGSFAGGVVLTLAVMLTVFLGYKLAPSRQKVRYCTIKEEHEAII